MSQKLIAGGAWVQVKVKDTDGKWKAIGLASGCSYDEDWAIQPANVLNHLGPISYDSQGYSCTITINTFVPENPAAISILPDGGEITIKDLLPTRDTVQTDGKGKQFDGLQFVNTATQESLHEFADVIIASNGEQVAPNSYVTANIRMNAVKRTK
ncbi:MAG: hypothetical protein C4K49_10570 [Candidatus Thorarchaeota archaeon]|nr:MAG: hypothetical protein C4K49_10570 [Candidatus Thorarchaeota archaeon]